MIHSGTKGNKGQFRASMELAFTFPLYPCNHLDDYMDQYSSETPMSIDECIHEERSSECSECIHEERSSECSECIHEERSSECSECIHKEQSSECPRSSHFFHKFSLTICSLWGILCTDVSTPLHRVLTKQKELNRY